jgi:hypothetical protein
VGDVPPKTSKGGESPTLATPPRVGPKTLANPQPTGVGKRGVQGGEAPMAGGLGDVPPKTKKGDELPTLATPPRVGPKTLANPKPTGVGKRGVQGAQAPWQGVWGMCPQKPKEGASRPLLATPPRVGPKTLANPKPTGVGKRGSRGAKPPGRGFGGCAPTKPKPPQGVWGMCPQKPQKGTSLGDELPTLATPPRVGPKTLANPKPTGVGKRGVQGAKPPGRGFGGCAPKNQKRGRVAHISNPATSGAQNAGKP